MEYDGNIATLLIHDDVDEANRLVSLLRNADYLIDPHYAADAVELNKKLQERNWDLLLAQFSAQSVPARNIIHQLRRFNKDIPVIFIIAGFNASEIVEALKMGAADAIPEDEDQYFIQAIARALFNLEQRRKLRYWKRRFSESEDRFENLILSSQDAIAIIKEGTYVLVNDTYAAFFGYDDADSMLLLPVFDTIAESSQGDFKKYLRPLDEQDAWDNESLHFQCLRGDDSAAPVRAVLSQIDFHGEPALQLLVKKHFIAGRDEDASQVAQLTAVRETDIGKIRLHEMVESINNTIRRAVKSNEDALLLYIQVDQYEALQTQLGIGRTEEGIAQLAQFLDVRAADRLTFGRIREEAFTLIVAGSDTRQGVALADSLRQAAAAQIFSTAAGSFTCTLSIAVTALGEATTSADETLAACQRAVQELQKPDPSGKVGNAVKLCEQVFDLSANTAEDEDILRIGRLLIKKDLVSLAFQPLLPLHGLKDEIYEVLMRGDQSMFAEGEIPQDFIARIFRTEIGTELDRLVLEAALKKLVAKKAAAPLTKLCLHLCQATIEDDKFTPWLHKTLATHQVAAADLIFLMREIDIGRNMGKAADMLDKLRKLGAATGITHFGVSINPMTIFNRVSVDYVKVDNLLSEKAQKDKNALLTLKSLLQELKAAQRTVIVPFIESAGVIPTLWQAGVDFLQGHYIQTPMVEMNFDFSQE
ncbi:MAG: EAL domain-containing protein [Porticoccaceae bacterium]